MKWLKKWMFKAIKEGSALLDAERQNEVAFNEPGIKLAGATLAGPSRFSQHGMNFSIYKANGGYVLEYRSYDRKTDRENNCIHIIRQEEDIGQQLAQIITYEELRK